ncbi:uncharacterized protein LOC125945090 [Dermacentor silvarum]|uniref:uncharacterized protein LOC125945090 n=1 Tax=Dermacentor silvarum TaxID=543639 RepID=UPI0021016B0E|nr:uncharacterized protein LOC125945090 [Dermacentor silvarum]
MIVAGDFNAPNTAWGYVASRAKGKDLLNDADELDLMLITNAADSTRTGNSVNRDTTPDLTFVRNVPNYQWNNLFEELGSDHHIVETMINTPSREPRKMTYVDWDKFREFRHERRTGNESIEQWTSQQKADVKAATKEIETDLPVQSMDSRLAHMLEAKQSLTRRWKEQRHKRRLRKRISSLNRLIEEYCTQLSNQQWNEVCDAEDGRINSGTTWHLLKHLLDRTRTKADQGRTLNRIMHEELKNTTENDLIDRLADKYLPLAKNARGTTAEAYRGKADPELDRDFSTEEVRTVLQNLNTKSAPGPDGVTNKALRNLDDTSIETLTEEINKIWRNGALPEDWKTASSCSSESLVRRPTSITSDRSR